MSDESGLGSAAQEAPPSSSEPTTPPARAAKQTRPASGAAKAAAKSSAQRASTPRTTTPRASSPKPAAGSAPSASTAAETNAAKPATSKKPAAPRTPAAAKKPVATKKPAAAKKPAATKKPVATKKPTAATTSAAAAASEPKAVLEAPSSPAPGIERERPVVDELAAPAVAPAAVGDPVLVLESLTKTFGDHVAVDEVTLSLDPGTFTGIVGPNGAGKTTTLSMITGLLRPTSGRVLVAGTDVWKHPRRAKRQLGVLPDRLHTFDRLTGGQLLYYTGVLHGLDRRTARERTKELAEAFKVEHAMGRLVTDYSSGMLKKIALAAALVHGPRLLVLDEPFESVDPVSAMTVAQILRDFAAAGGTVLLSSHSMELVQRICDHVAVIVDGRLIAGGTVDEVRGDRSLEERFIDLAGADEESIADLTWLRRFSS